MDYTFKRNILVIDLKSFFASCECVDRGLDAFSTPLVVADPKRKDGAITLAVTPYCKSLGMKSRARMYENKKFKNLIVVPPRMSLYIKKSTEVINIYLDFISSEDLHVYSIDEAFLDVTNYLKMYKMTDYELAKKIMETVKEKTGLTATCGIGPNMLLAKIAMDIEAKHNKDCIASWNYEDIPNKLWTISPLSNMWGIGSRMEINLNNMGIKNIYDLAHYDKNKLIKRFGIMGEEIYNHANGIDLSLISDYKNLKKEKSYGHSQVLFKNYYSHNIKLIIEEMVEVLSIRLRKNRKQTGLISFGIGYSKDIGGGFHHMMKLSTSTDNEKIILDTCLKIFDNYYDDSPIRKVSISFGKLNDKNSIQLNIFEDYEKNINEDNINNAIDFVHSKYGKNSLFKASGLLKDSTIRERNGKIGGHSS